MRPSFLLFLSLALVSSMGFAESRPKTPEPTEVFSKTSAAFCNKMDQCSSEKISQKNCVVQMQDAFEQIYRGLSENKKTEVQNAQVSQCVKSIQKTPCEALKSAQKLEGCEFIEKLNGL